MLSDKVLEELVRNTPMSEHLITAAWPNLSTESRLQIIEATVDVHLGSAPLWLSLLSMQDEAPIVRYWAARLTTFKKPSPNDTAQGERAPFAFLYSSTDEEQQLYATAKADPSELVQISVDMGETLSYRTLSVSSQFRRLAFLRSLLSMPDLGSFFAWLDSAIGVEVPDRELSECAREFISLKKVQEKLNRDPDDFVDGMAAYTAGKDIEIAWQVVKKAGPMLQNSLIYTLPTRMGLATIKPDELAQMPEEVLSALPWRSDNSKEVATVIELMRAEPERFPEEAIASLNRADEIRLPSGEQLAQAKAKHAVDRSQAILDTLIGLQEKISALSEQVRTLSQ